MWKCKNCGSEITGVGFLTYETFGSLNKRGNIKKHEIFEEIDEGTDEYRCDNCFEESEVLTDIAYWEED